MRLLFIAEPIDVNVSGAEVFFSAIMDGNIALGLMEMDRYDEAN